MEAETLQERIAAFPRWQYRFEFAGGVSTPVFHRSKVNRQEQQRRYFFDALLRVSGGTLAGRRVLDLGMNAGFWSLAAIEAGADFVLGIDARAMHVEQANLVFEAKGVERARYRFEEANVFAHELGEGFDVVLCLGLLNHSAKPVELFELMAGAGAQIIVIDTALSRAPASFFEVSYDRDLNDPRNAVDYELVLVPTRGAVIDLARQFGFEAVALARNMTDFAGMNDYREGRQLAFIAGKDVSLRALAQEPPPARSPWWVTLMNPAKREWWRLGL